MARKDKYHIGVEKDMRRAQTRRQARSGWSADIYMFYHIISGSYWSQTRSGWSADIYALPYDIGGYWSQTRRQARTGWSAESAKQINIYAANCADGHYLLPPLLACTINAHKLTITNHRILQLVRLPCLNVHLITKLLIAQQYNYMGGQHICRFTHMP